MGEEWVRNDREVGLRRNEEGITGNEGGMGRRVEDHDAREEMLILNQGDPFVLAWLLICPTLFILFVLLHDALCDCWFWMLL